MQRTALLLAWCVALVAVLTAAPAGAAELDRARLGRAVRSAITPVLTGLTVTRVACPAHVRARAGSSAVCEVTASGLTLLLRVTTTDRRGGIRIESTQAVIAKDRAEDFVRNNATLPARADCGEAPYIVRIPGAPFACTATFDDGTVQQVLVTVDDVAGNVHISAVS